MQKYLCIQFHKIYKLQYVIANTKNLSFPTFFDIIAYNYYIT